MLPCPSDGKAIARQIQLSLWSHIPFLLGSHLLGQSQDNAWHFGCYLPGDGYRWLKMLRSPVILQAIPPPPVPSGFTASLWHENIALDVAAGKVWLRDHNGGRQAVLEKRQIIGLEIRNELSRATATHIGEFPVMGPQSPVNNYLVIKTTDVTYPVNTVRFSWHGQTFRLAAEINNREAREWLDRINAFCRS